MTHIKIYVPTYNADTVDNIAMQLTKLLGGCTIIPNCVGYWKNPRTNVYELDNITIIESYSDREDISFGFEVGAICANLRNTLGQKSVMYIIDGKHHLV